MHPDHGGSEMDESGEVHGSPVIACSEAAKVLELAEAALDAVALFVGVGVVRNDGRLPTVSRRKWSPGQKDLS